MEAFIDQLLGYQAAGEVLPLTMVLLPERTLVGIIRFLDIDRENRMVEIGTWLDSRYWRSPLNSEAKLLTLGYAFEEEKVHRLQLKTDSRNVRSQAAIERLGQVAEGALREAHLVRNGYFRTSLYYSILESEWPGEGKARGEAIETVDGAPRSLTPITVAGTSASASRGTPVFPRGARSLVPLPRPTGARGPSGIPRSR